MQTKGFTPTANPLTTISVLITASIVAFIASIHQRSPLHKYLYLVSAAISTIASTAYLSLMLNGGSLAPIILPLSSSWSLLLDSLKDPHNLIFGVGLTNFSALYTSVKPLFLNSTIFWNLIPTTASTEIIQLIITTGILGFGALLLLLYSGLKQVSNLTTISSKPVSALFILSTITLFLIPGSIIGYVLLFISLGILCSGESSILLVQKSTSYLLALGIFSIVIFSGFYLFKYVSAEYFLNQARISLQNSDAKQVYEYSLKAVEQIPSMSNYRLSYSQVNLSIASSLSQQSNPTEEQLKNINQLITQALREAKIATTLRPHDSFSWQNLAKIYANLSTVAEGSDKFAIESYSQAIALDAGNPSLRTDFAILLSQLASTSTDETTKLTYLTRAASEFRTAIQLKNDFAPAYYNLAKVLESAGDYQNALANMQIAIELLTSDSPDLDRARQELEVLKTKLPVPSPAPES
jgi:tetratricopeptide (TPR) repeat protein